MRREKILSGILLVLLSSLWPLLTAFSIFGTGNALPLSGGTMTGTISFPCTPSFMFNDVAGNLLAQCTGNDLAFRPESAIGNIRMQNHGGVTLFLCGGDATPACQFGVTPTSTVACVAGYTRVGPSECDLSAPNGAVTTVATTCTSVMTPPANAKSLSLSYDLKVTGSATATGEESVALTIYTENTCTTSANGDFGVLMPGLSCPLDIAATTQNCYVSGYGRVFASGVTGLWAKKVETVLSGGSTVARVYSNPGFYTD